MEMVLQILADFWDVLGKMSPYLLFGFGVAGVLSVLISPRMVERHLGGEGFYASLKAAAIGVPLPLCSCGVIPVSASLRRHGAGQGPTISFLISTPQTGVDSILVTFSLLGSIFAIFRPLVALASGLGGGLLVSLFTRNAAAKSGNDECCGSGDGHADNHVHDEQCPANMLPSCCCEDECGQHNHDHPEMAHKTLPRWLEALRYGFVALPQDIGRSLLLGLVIAALISALLPAERIPGILEGGIWAMLIMMVAGIPVYVCATASVPVAAALIAKGVSPGAALVFLMTGPATNAATIATIWRVMGKRTAGLYLLTVAASAIISGLLLDGLFDISGVSPGQASMLMMPHWLQHGSAVVLLAILSIATVWPMIKARRKQAVLTDKAKPIVLTIKGMTCNHCAEAIKRTLQEQPNVQAAMVDLQTGQASITGDDLDPAKLIQAVSGLGYDAKLKGSSK